MRTFVLASYLVSGLALAVVSVGAPGCASPEAEPTTPDGAVGDPGTVDGGAPPADAPTRTPDDKPDDGDQPPRLQLEPASKDFGDLLVAQRTDAVPLKLTNTGAGPSGALGVTVSGDTGEFELDVSACKSHTLAAGASCTATVRFHPTRSGAATITIAAQDATHAGVATSTKVTGRGLAPSSLSIEPAQVSFGRVPIAATDAVRAFHVENRGDAAIAGLQLALGNGAFELIQNSCGASLAGHATCDAVVRFKPARGGAQNVALTATGVGLTTVSALTGVGTGTVTVRKSGDGAASGSIHAPGFADCGKPECSYEVADEAVTFTADAPATLARFMGWSQSCAQARDCTLSINAAGQVLDVTFRQLVPISVQAVSVSGIGAGQASGAIRALGTDCAMGASCTVYALRGDRVTLNALVTDVDGNHNRLASWTGCDSVDGTNCAMRVDAARAAQASFVREYVVTAGLAFSTGGLQGHVFGNGLDCRGGSCTQRFDYGFEISLHADHVREVSSAFASWTSGPCAGSSAQDCAFRVVGDQAFVAQYGPRHELYFDESTLEADRDGSPCSTSAHCYYDDTTTVTVSVLARICDENNKRWAFDSWTACPNPQGQSCIVGLFGRIAPTSVAVKLKPSGLCR